MLFCSLSDAEPRFADSCRSPPGTVVLDSQGKDLVQGAKTYPYAGLPLPQEGLLLFRASLSLSPLHSAALGPCG